MRLAAISPGILPDIKLSRLMGRLFLGWEMIKVEIMLHSGVSIADVPISSIIFYVEGHIKNRGDGDYAQRKAEQITLSFKAYYPSCRVTYKDAE